MYSDILMSAFVSFASKNIGRQFEIDNSNRRPIDAIFSHLILKDVLVDQIDSLGRNISLNKGFYVFGDLGTGKSTLMKLFAQFMRENNDKTFRMITTSEACQFYKTNGSIDRFTLNENGVSGRPAIFCFDELGREPRSVDHFGTKIDVMSQILQMRYTTWQNEGLITHFITNLNFEELKAIYGDFIVERIIEMSNLIEFNGDSRRV